MEPIDVLPAPVSKIDRRNNILCCVSGPQDSKIAHVCSLISKPAISFTFPGSFEPLFGQPCNIQIPQQSPMQERQR